MQTSTAVLLHPVLAVVLIYPLLGIVFALAGKPANAVFTKPAARHHRA